MREGRSLTPWEHAFRVGFLGTSAVRALLLHMYYRNNRRFYEDVRACDL